MLHFLQVRVVHDILDDALWLESYVTNMLLIVLGWQGLHHDPMHLSYGGEL